MSPVPIPNAPWLSVGDPKMLEQLLAGTQMPQAPAYSPSYSSGQGIAPFLDMTAFNRLKADVTRSGASPWARLASQKAFMQEQDARERAKRETRSAAAQAESDLASRGGLSSGARERLAMGGARDMIAASQDAGRQGNLAQLGVGIQDEQNRLSMIPQLMSAAGQQQAARESDLERSIKENERKNAYQQNLYNQQMAAWAAGQQANAVEQSGKK